MDLFITMWNSWVFSTNLALKTNCYEIWEKKDLHDSKYDFFFFLIENVFHLFSTISRVCASILQMVLGGPSAFLRNLFPPEEPCECNTLTVILPDFDANTIKNMLGLLYTGEFFIIII